MRKLVFKKERKVQQTHLDYTGVHKQIKTEMQLFVYDTNELIECEEIKVDEIKEQIDLTKNNWLNIHGLNEVDIIKSIGDYLKVDNFMLGDILNTTKRTKLDEYHDVLFFNIKSILPEENSDNIKVEQISFFVKERYFGIVSRKKKRSFYIYSRANENAFWNCTRKKC